ncbi:HD domain-containing protein [Maridesulfovibrio bastinii]|uniref:HD domain-containing protein n=1 Tax=Maridesulfovibrio bastinii TaxID=47157 RepID=UPI0004091885|nr:HD domain-containing protein [Maridesulfovibrio bastinii]
MNTNTNTTESKSGKLRLPPLEPDLPSPIPVSFDPGLKVPADSECEAWWDMFGMFDNIKAHSRLVAHIATCIAEMAVKNGLETDIPTVRASALMHDIAKAYCITNGGNHSQVGASWAFRLTENPVVAMGVLHHVYWPFELDAKKYFLPIVVSYSDKRVKHDQLTTLQGRFSDLEDRYGKTELIRQRIRQTLKQAELIEAELNNIVGEELNECSFDCGRLV